MAGEVQFGAGNITVSPISREFGKVNLHGKRITFKIGESEIVHDAFEIPAVKEQRCLLVLQDSAPEVTPDLAEPKQVLSLFSKSFVIRNKTN